jgi:hypothetical protein
MGEYKTVGDVLDAFSNIRSHTYWLRKLETEQDEIGSWGRMASDDACRKFRELIGAEEQALEADPQVDRLRGALWSLGMRLDQGTIDSVCERLGYGHGVERERIKDLPIDRAVELLQPPPANIRDAATEARDKFIYDEWQKGTPEPQIRATVNKTAGWTKIGRKQGIKPAAARYAKRHGFPEPLTRKPGRPKKTTEER